jgi:hypothetical protein
MIPRRPFPGRNTTYTPETRRNSYERRQPRVALRLAALEPEWNQNRGAKWAGKIFPRPLADRALLARAELREQVRPWRPSSRSRASASRMASALSRRLAPNGLEAWAEVLGRGYERLVGKDEAAPYRGGRTLSWLKVRQPVGCPDRRAAALAALAERKTAPLSSS